jgi:hypothetical protein
MQFLLYFTKHQVDTSGSTFKMPQLIVKILHGDQSVEIADIGIESLKQTFNKLLLIGW